MFTDTHTHITKWDQRQNSRQGRRHGGGQTACLRLKLKLRVVWVPVHHNQGFEFGRHVH